MVVCVCVVGWGEWEGSIVLISAMLRTEMKNYSLLPSKMYLIVKLDRHSNKQFTSKECNITTNNI